jgi:hypothetical protein
MEQKENLTENETRTVSSTERQRPVVPLCSEMFDDDGHGDWIESPCEVLARDLFQL